MKDDNTQKNIDKEFVLLFTVTDESESWYHDENKKKANKPNEIVGMLETFFAMVIVNDRQQSAFVVRDRQRSAMIFSRREWSSPIVSFRH